MAVTNQTATGWSFHSLLVGSPLNQPRTMAQKTSKKASSLLHSSFTATSAGFVRPIRGRQNKLILKLNWYVGKQLSLTNPSARFFCNIASGRTGLDRFVRYTSDGETKQQSYTWPANQRPRVCILGGGFGGLYTALRLESLVWPDDKKPQVLLVDQSDKFVFKPMLYELLSGEVDPWEIAPAFKELLKNTSIRFVQDRVKLLHPYDFLNHSQMNVPGSLHSAGAVLLESGVLVEYDWLVLALGAAAKLDVPGSAEFAYPFITLEDAIKVDEQLKLLERKHFGKDSSPISVAIVGCGYSGVELAATISERLQERGIVQAINVQTSICPSAPSGNRESALKVLSSRNTKLFLGYYVSAISVASNGIDSTGAIRTKQERSTNDPAITNKKYFLELKPAQRGLQSQILEADIVLWTVGSKSPVPELEPSDQPRAIPLNGRGQAETDETLRVKGHPRIFAIGDSAALGNSSGKLLPATAQVAFQQADFVGWNLWAAINGRPLLPFRFQNLGEMMTLGTNDATISPSFIDGFTLDGPIAHVSRKLVYLLRMPTDEHRVKVGISWLTKSVVEYTAYLQTTITNALSGS